MPKKKLACISKTFQIQRRKVHQRRRSLQQGRSSRRGDRRYIINSKQQLQQFMSDQFNASMEFLNIDW